MDKVIKIKNRSASQVIYSIPEIGIRREFAPGEIKNIPHDELEKLTWQAGGREILTSFLQVMGSKEIEELGIHAEPEYHMNETQIIELLKSGSFDAFLDCLQFAPTGVIDLIKTFSVELPLTDTRKIEALKEKTGFDVMKALEMKKLDQAPEEEISETAKETTAAKAAPISNKRRTNVSYEQPEEEEETPAKTLPNYNVVSK